MPASSGCIQLDLVRISLSYCWASVGNSCCETVAWWLSPCCWTHTLLLLAG